MVENKKETKVEKEEEKKLKDLKIQLLKNSLKRKNVKKEIARVIGTKQNMESKKK